MSFYEKYELSRLLREDGARSFAAVEKSSGRPVFLHLLDPSQAALANRASELRRRRELPASRDVVEVGSFAGSRYVVTSELPNFQGLPAWIDAALGSEAPAAERPASPATETPTRSGPSPRLVGGAGGRGDPEEPRIHRKPAAPPAVERPKPPLPAPPSAPTEQPPGEFTRMFGGEAAASDDRPPAVPPSESDPPAGEFTRLFGPAENQPKSAGRGAPPPARAATGPETGEFTRMFGGPAAPERDESRQRPEPSPATEQPAGEFTQFFGPSSDASSQTREPESAPPPRPMETGEYEAPDRPLERKPGRREWVSDVEAGRGPITRSREETFGGGYDDIFSGGREASVEEDEFGRMFGRDWSREASDDPLGADPNLAPSGRARPFQGHGEFTRMFGDDAAREEAPSLSDADSRDDASAVFQNPVAGAGSKRPPPTAPGEYTRMMSGAPAPPATPRPAASPEPQPPAAAQPATAAPRRSNKWLFVALAAAVVIAGLAIGAALYFFVSRGGSEESPAATSDAESSAATAPVQDFSASSSAPRNSGCSNRNPYFSA